MFVNGVAPVSLSQLTSPAVSPSNRRQSEDAIARQLEQALQNGDLNAAESAYQQLAAFGPNNSGPFKGPAEQAEFQALGQDLQSGNLSAAKSDCTTLGNHVLVNDARTFEQARLNGDAQGAAAAMANLQGDYWAVYGQVFNRGDLQSLGQGFNPAAISVQA